MNLLELTDRVERLLKGRGLDGYEIMAGDSRNLAIEAKEGKVDTFKCSNPVGVSIRLLKGQGMGFSFSTSLDDADLGLMIDNALVGAQTQTPDPDYDLPGPQQYPVIDGLYDPNLAAVAESDKVALALELERLVLASDPRVKRVRKATYGENDYSVYLRNSRGVAGGYRGTSVSCSVVPIAEANGDSQMGWDFGFGARFSDIDIARIAAGAVERAVGLLGARKIPSMRCPAVLDNHVATEILEVLAPSFLAENVFKGKSLLAGKEGEKCFAPCFRISDNGILPGGMATTPFDGEGVAQQDTLLVDGGELKGFLYDMLYGRKMGRESTGNAARGGVKGLPHLGVTNFIIERGQTPAPRLLEGVGQGILLTDVIGMHTANTISGDFSVGASGYLVENGAIVHPVKEIAISGNIMDLFRNVEQVGDDLRIFGSVSSPSLRIAALDVSGT